MSTYTQIFYHLVFRTNDREPVLAPDERRPQLFLYIWGILQSRHCRLYRINGVHGTTQWIKDTKLLSGFSHWQDGYGPKGMQSSTTSATSRNTIDTRASSRNVGAARAGSPARYSTLPGLATLYAEIRGLPPTATHRGALRAPRCQDLPILSPRLARKGKAK